MAKVFGILSTIVLAFSAFVANKNGEKYKQEISLRQGEEKRLDDVKSRLKRAELDLEKTTESRQKTEETVVTLLKKKVGQEKTNAEQKATLEAKTAEVTANKNKLDELNKKLEGLPNLNTLGPILKQRKTELEELESTIKTAEAKLANLTDEATKVEKVNANYREIASWPAAKKSNPNLKTRIRSIYPDWGFVTLSAGNTAGVITSSSLDVVRDGEVIAKLVVTAVEPGSASASIVPDSVKADTVLMVGDSVVPSK